MVLRRVAYIVVDPTLCNYYKQVVMSYDVVTWCSFQDLQQVQLDFQVLTIVCQHFSLSHDHS